jgi:hypothetical protein
VGVMTLKRKEGEEEMKEEVQEVAEKEDMKD